MLFTKWPSIENSYQQKNIDWWLEKYPMLADETFVLTEKLHGSNFQWYIQPKLPVLAGSRSGWINMAGSFQGVVIAELLTTEQPTLTKLQELADNTGVTLRLFGELFGGNIQKGVDYGPEKQVLYFGIMVNDVLQPFSALVDYLPRHKIVPVISFANGLAAALAFNPHFNSWILEEVDNNTVEGVVIMPYNKVYQNEVGSTFMLKNKNKEFAEKAHAPKVRVEDSRITQLNAIFLTYITDNRLQGIFSKFGKIEQKAQIGQYLQRLIEDAKGDFLIENDVTGLTMAEQKQVFNVGSAGFELLKPYL